MIEIIKTSAESDVLAVRQLFEQYAASLDIDLCFQGFPEELASLPGCYAPPRGVLYLARYDGLAVGCIALRPFAKATGEIKRLYVVPGYRGKGIAHSLVTAVVGSARNIGYTSLVLDTLDTMQSAIALYESFGFRRVKAYYPNPLPNAVYFQKEL